MNENTPSISTSEQSAAKTGSKSDGSGTETAPSSTNSLKFDASACVMVLTAFQAMKAL